jgi:hypothetical protein
LSCRVSPDWLKFAEPVRSSDGQRNSLSGASVRRPARSSDARYPEGRPPSCASTSNSLSLAASLATRQIPEPASDDREAERRPDGKGAYFVTLRRDVLDKLNYLRGSGESCSGVIIRAARG